jgi:AraC family transcriptional regulator
MNPQIQETLQFIEKNLNEELTIELLAKIAGYSKFHFSRIFKVYVGESVMDYVTRLKIEKSSFELIGEKSIIDIAFNFGYKTPTGYNKAFKKSFGISPSQYKKEKINFLKNFKRNLMNTPQIIQLEEKYIVYERAIGAYEKADIAWENLSTKLNLLGKDTTISETIFIEEKDGEYYGVCHDDPTVTKEENIRYDAAISWEKGIIDFLSYHGFDTKTLEAGKYATVTYEGNPNKNLDTWFALYNWCEENGYEFKNLPPFEKYLNITKVLNQPEKQITQIYIPIK